MENKINILIIHYNTPLLTDCLVRSINKFVPNNKIYIFDNSDKFPFKKRYNNLVIINNTKGQYINFDEWLKRYPKKNLSGGKLNKWGSAKHCYSVDKCMDIIGEDFILLDSDILLTKDISELFNKKYIFAGETIIQPKSKITRVLPYICYINVPAAQKNGIRYFNENYMHGLHCTNINKAADSYDTGAYFYLKSKKLPIKNIKWADYCVHYGSASWINERRSNKKMPSTKMSEKEFVENYKSLWNININVEKNKKVIYTCITGPYDCLDDPFIISPGYDYVCFTNDNAIKSDIWDIRPIPKELDGLSEVKKQRCIKINPHKYLPEYELSIWVDGNVKLKKDANEFVDSKCKNGNVFIPSHPERNCIYEEMKACIKLKKDTEQNIAPQRKRYTEEGFPKNYGLVQSNIVIRRHNNPDCIKLMETWWEEVKNGSHRDQLSFDYARWKNKDVNVVFLDKDTCKTDYFYWDKVHGKKLSAKKIVEKVERGIGTQKIEHPMLPMKPIVIEKETVTTVKRLPSGRKDTTVKRITVTPTLKRKVLSKKLKRFLS